MLIKTMCENTLAGVAASGVSKSAAARRKQLLRAEKRA